MAEAKTQPSQEFEKVLKDSATEVASFERHEKSLLERIQHALHSNPAHLPFLERCTRLARRTASAGAMPSWTSTFRNPSWQVVSFEH